MALRLVPFNPTWISHERIDIKAIYRRPRFVSDDYGEMHREYDANGLPTWDLTGPLPVKQHTKWTQKGFEYVTLANRDSLAVAYRMGTLPSGTTFRDFDQHQTGGPWNYRKYIEGQADTQTTDLDDLRRDVEAFGAEAVETLRRRTDPHFRLPEALKGTTKKGKGKEAA